MIQSDQAALVCRLRGGVLWPGEMLEMRYDLRRWREFLVGEKIYGVRDEAVNPCNMQRMSGERIAPRTTQ